MRIAFGRISQETNSLSPVDSSVADFKRTHWFEGPDLLVACGRWQPEVPGFARNLELSGVVRALRSAGVEPVPLLSAWAVPGGPLSDACFEELRDTMVQHLQDAGPLDAVVLSLHGAMGARDLDFPESQLLEAVRAQIGPDMPLVVTLDLHGQLDRRLVEACGVIVGYRTNPHRDHAAVGRRAGEIAVGMARGEVKPETAWRSLPMVLGGGTTIDVLPTMRPIYQLMKRMQKDPKVLAVSLFTCHIWNEVPRLGWSPVVVTDGDPALGERLVEQLADACWGVRHVLPPTLPTAEEAILDARNATFARMFGTVCMSDASDMVGCGAPGESTHLLRALAEHGKGLRVLAPVRDAVVVAEVWDAAIGDTVQVSVGGRLTPLSGAPLPVTGVLKRKVAEGPFGRAVVLDAGDLKLVVTEEAPLAMKPSFYVDMGLSPWRADVVVVKSLFPFRLYFLLQNRKTLYARTRGTTDLDAVLGFEQTDPVHPRVELDDWREVDRSRRLG
jgi:microcystin degradation protein MlrC